MQAHIEVEKKDASEFYVFPANSKIEEILDFHFSKPVEGYKYMPLFKSGLWDGKVHYFRKFHQTLPVGLFPYFYEWSKQSELKVNFKWKLQERDISRKELKEFVEENSPFELRDYQFEALFAALKKRRLCIEIPTSGGKTIIIYLLAKWFSDRGKKVLIIVPRLQLVEQTYSGFSRIKDRVFKIHGSIDWDIEDIKNHSIIISTWQSIYKETKKFFKLFDVLIIDEAHTVKAKNLQTIAQKCVNAWDRFGFSGTYPSKKYADYWTIVSSIGPIEKFTTYTQLVENNYISPFEIITVILKYPEKYVRFFYDLISAAESELGARENRIKSYHLEVDFIMRLKARYRFILKLAEKFEKNSIFLFNRIFQGQLLYKMFLKKFKSKEIYYIDGSTDVNSREFYKKRMEESDDVFIIASYGTFSEGIDIKNVHNIVFCSSYKSKIKVLQSIGRALRKYPEKVAKIYDIVDSFKDGSVENITYKHFLKRVKYYQKHQMLYSVKSFNMEKICNPNQIEIFNDNYNVEVYKL